MLVARELKRKFDLHPWKHRDLYCKQYTQRPLISRRNCVNTTPRTLPLPTPIYTPFDIHRRSFVSCSEITLKQRPFLFGLVTFFTTPRIIRRTFRRTTRTVGFRFQEMFLAYFFVRIQFFSIISSRDTKHIVINLFGYIHYMQAYYCTRRKRSRQRFENRESRADGY